MSDIRYSVEVEFLQKGSFASTNQSLNQVTAKVSDLNKELGHLGKDALKSIDSAFSGFAHTAISAIGMAGAAAGGAFAVGLGKTLKEGLHFGAMIEEAQLSIATLKSTLGNLSFDKAREQSTAFVEGLRRDAAALPGEFKDVLEMATSLQPAAHALGLADEQVRKMATRGVAMAAALGIQQGTFAHEMASALQGKVSANMPLARKLGIHQSEWSKLKPEERLNYFDKLFSKADPAVEAYKRTWVGITSNARDQSRNLARIVAGPLQQSLKDSLSNGLGWLETNESLVQNWARNAGIYIQRAFLWGEQAIHRWGPPLLHFGSVLEKSLTRAFHTAEPYLKRVEDLSLRLLQDPSKLVGGAGAIGGIFAGVKAGSGALSLGGSIAPLLGGGEGIAALGAAAGPAALGLAGIAVSAAGAVDVLTNVDALGHDLAMAFAGDIAGNIKGIGVELLHYAENVRPVVDALGVGFLWAVRSGTEQIEMLLKAVNWFGDGLTSLATSARDAASAISDMIPDSLRRPKLGGTDGDIISGLQTQLENERLGNFALRYSPHKSINMPDSAGAPERKIPHQTVNVHGGINIRIDGSHDPERVAVNVEKIIRRNLAAPNGRSNPILNPSR